MIRGCFANGTFIYSPPSRGENFSTEVKRTIQDEKPSTLKIRSRLSLRKAIRKIWLTTPRYGFTDPTAVWGPRPPNVTDEHFETETCTCCGAAIFHNQHNNTTQTHDVQICHLVNLALRELDARPNHPVRVNVYDQPEPLKGYYSPIEPYTIHLSSESHRNFLAYIVFHETKHMIDCLTKGWSEENTPDMFARLLCGKYGFRKPPLDRKMSPSQSGYPDNQPFGLGEENGVPSHLWNIKYWG